MKFDMLKSPLYQSLPRINPRATLLQRDQVRGLMRGLARDWKNKTSRVCYGAMRTLSSRIRYPKQIEFTEKNKKMLNNVHIKQVRNDT